MSMFRAAANSVARPSAVHAHASHIVLNNIARGSTCNDIRRALATAGVTGVKEVKLLYEGYRPVRKAVLTMIQPDFTRDALRDIGHVGLGPDKINAFSTTTEKYFSPRSRGGKGRAEAMANGRLTGDGPSAGFPYERTVTLSGAPRTMSRAEAESLAKGYELTDPPEDAVLKASQIRGTPFSRIMYTFKTHSEAQRFVRKYHQTPYHNAILQAEIIY